MLHPFYYSKTRLFVGTQCPLTQQAQDFIQNIGLEVFRNLFDRNLVLLSN